MSYGEDKTPPVLDSMAGTVREMLHTRRIGHDAGQLLVEIMEKWGGPTQFAHDLYTEFKEARPGSLIRQNILEMIQKLVVNNTNHNITKIDDPADLDDQDIDDRIQHAIRKAQDFQHEKQQRSRAREAKTAEYYTQPELQEEGPPE